MARRNSILVSKTLYQIGVITLIGSVLWTLLALAVSFSKNPTKIEVDKKTLEPIMIGISEETLEQLTKREKVVLRFEPVNDSEIASSSASIVEGGQQ
jgi:hypothetical protein